MGDDRFNDYFVLYIEKEMFNFDYQWNYYAILSNNAKLI